MALVTTERQERVFVVTLNRPEKRNALTRAMNWSIREAMLEFRNDDTLWVAVMCGKGQDFCAGMDLGNQGEGPRTYPGGITRDYECWKPIVAALQGNVLGAGLELALCADLRIGDETTRLGAPEVKWGLMQGAGATQRLPRALPFAVALEMLFTGEAIDAARAERLGLLNMVCEPGKAFDGAFEYAERICARAPLGVRRAKEAAYRGWDQPMHDGLRTEMLLSRLLAGSNDLREGRAAFRERRPPQWTAT